MYERSEVRRNLQLLQQGNVGRKFVLVDCEISDRESSYLNALNLNESDNEELIEACGCQYASYQPEPLALLAEGQMQ